MTLEQLQNEEWFGHDDSDLLFRVYTVDVSTGPDSYSVRNFILTIHDAATCISNTCPHVFSSGTELLAYLSLHYGLEIDE